MMNTIQMTFVKMKIISFREKEEGGKKFAELCGKWVNPAAYSHMRGSHWLMWSRHHSVFCPDGRTAKELGSSQTTTTT